MPTGDYNPQSPDAMFAMILSELQSIKEMVAPVPDLKQKMAQVEKECPALGGSGACQSKHDYSFPNWSKWFLSILLSIAAAAAAFYSTIKGKP